MINGRERRLRAVELALLSAPRSRREIEQARQLVLDQVLRLAGRDGGR